MSVYHMELGNTEAIPEVAAIDDPKTRQKRPSHPKKPTKTIDKPPRDEKQRTQNKNRPKKTHRESLQHEEKSSKKGRNINKFFFGILVYQDVCSSRLAIAGKTLAEFDRYRETNTKKRLRRNHSAKKDAQKKEQERITNTREEQ